LLKSSFDHFTQIFINFRLLGRIIVYISVYAKKFAKLRYRILRFQFGDNGSLGFGA